jgi:hypothetical protein
MLSWVSKQTPLPTVVNPEVQMLVRKESPGLRSPTSLKRDNALIFAVGRLGGCPGKLDK